MQGESIPQETLDAEKTKIPLSLKQIFWMVGWLVSGAVAVTMSVLAMKAQLADTSRASEIYRNEAVKGIENLKGTLDAVLANVGSVNARVSEVRDEAWNVHDMEKFGNMLRDANPNLPMPFVVPDAAKIWRENRPKYQR